MHDGSNVSMTMVQLPGLNTPQFTWVRAAGLRPHAAAGRRRSTSPRSRPTAIVWAATHPPRGLGRRLDGRHDRRQHARSGRRRPLPRATNVKAQQTDQRVAADRRDNLFEPVAEDRGAHGPFDDQAKPRSLQLVASMHRRALGAGLLGALIGGAAAWRSR